MSFSYGAARNFVPLLSRLVLAAAFVPAGWLKIMGEERVFEGQDAQILKEMGVGQPVGATDELASLSGLPVILASYQYQEVETGSVRPKQEEEEEEEAAEEPPVFPPPAAEPEGPPAEEPDPGIEEPPAQPPRVEVIAQPEPAPQPSGAEETPQGGRVKAKRLYSVAVLLHNFGWPSAMRADLMAWAAAGTELVGGGLILIGLFSRLCGLGLAVVMGFAFYFTSLAAVTTHGFLELPIPDFNRVFTQLGLFVLAFGVMLTGAGGFSLDWLLFKRGGQFGFEQHDEVIDL
ncbi:MAG: DoxX family protein [Planctomycetota bacterium]|jgi:uncharacterized membrane protein YphA (DoxX/SURF4 family)